MSHVCESDLKCCQHNQVHLCSVCMAALFQSTRSTGGDHRLNQDISRLGNFKTHHIPAKGNESEIRVQVVGAAHSGRWAKLGWIIFCGANINVQHPCVIVHAHWWSWLSCLSWSNLSQSITIFNDFLSPGNNVATQIHSVQQQNGKRWKHKILWEAKQA